MECPLLASDVRGRSQAALRRRRRARLKMADETPAGQRKRRQIATADREAALCPGIVDRDQLDVRAGAAAPRDLERHDADAEVGGDDAQRRVEAGDDDPVGDRAAGARGGALQHRVHGGGGRQADVVEGERLLEADRGASGERVAGVDRERQPVAPVGAMREALEVDVVPADAERRVAVAHLANEVARNALLDVDLDVLVAGLAHERCDVVEQRLGDRRGGRDQAHMAVDAAARTRRRRRRCGPS